MIIFTQNLPHLMSRFSYFHARFVILISFLIIGMKLSAQKPEWIRNADQPEKKGGGRTSGKRIAIDKAGNIYVIGTSQGINVFNPVIHSSSENSSLSDGFLAKYNPHGDVLWVKSLFQAEHAISNRVLDLKVDNDDNVVFSGSCLSYSSVLGSEPGVGYFIAKIDSSANLLWTNFLELSGGSLRDHDTRGSRIAVDHNDNIFWLTDQINEFENTGGLVVMKYSSDGVELNRTFVTYNTSFYKEQSKGISIDREGNFIVCGNFPQQDYFFIKKFRNDGTPVWTVRGVDKVLITTLTVDDDGNVYFSAHFHSDSKIITPHGTIPIPESQLSIGKLSADGELLWLNPVGQANVDDISFSPDWMLYVTGTAFGSSTFYYQSYVSEFAGDSGFVMKISSDGNFQSIYKGEPLDVPETNWGSAVNGYQSVVDASGNLYTMGDFFEKQSWACIPATTFYYSFFLAKHGVTVSPLHTVNGPGPLCEGTEITLTTDLLSNGVLYKWFTPDTAFLEGTLLHNAITMVTKREHNGHPAIVSITDNCDEYFATPYILEVLSGPDTPRLVKGMEIVCAESSAEFKIDPVDDNTYHWLLPEGVISTQSTRDGGVFFFGEDFVSGEVNITASNLCGTSDTVFQIKTYNNPKTPMLAGSAQICPGSIGILRSVTPVAYAEAYQWDLPAGVVFDSNYPTNAPTLHAITNPDFKKGEITVRSVGVCKTSPPSSPIVITRVPNPASADELTGPQQICITTGSVSYDIKPIENADSYVWSVPDLFVEEGTIITTVPHINLTMAEPGSGWLNVLGDNKCHVRGRSSGLGIETYAPLAEPMIAIDKCDTQISVERGETFLWYFNGLPVPQLSGKTIVVTDSGLFHVEAENFCGAKKSNVIQAYPVLSSHVLIPNVITPNGDGKNDFLVIDKSLPQSSVLVINRSGESVYRSSSYQNNWSGRELPSGVYFITVKNSCLPQVYKGWLSVLR
jgi:gliding motility-associated-like protein